MNFTIMIISPEKISLQIMHKKGLLWIWRFIVILNIVQDLLLCAERLLLVSGTYWWWW